LRGALELIFNSVVTSAANRLSQDGFRKNGSKFRRVFPQSAALIEFQRSSTNTQETLSFTINLAVVCGLLLDPDGKRLQESRAIDGHLRARIGSLLPDQQDKWWKISAETDASALASEIADIIDSKAIPYLLRYVDPHDLMALWETGLAPGLTEKARVRELQALKTSLGKP